MDRVADFEHAALASEGHPLTLHLLAEVVHAEDAELMRRRDVRQALADGLERKVGVAGEDEVGGHGLSGLRFASSLSAPGRNATE